MYKKFKNRLRLILPNIYFILNKNKIYIKYLLSGGLATFIHVGLLYFLTDIAGIWYIFSTSLAFVAAFVFSFNAQKFWTFRDNDNYKIKRQAGAYFSVGLFNLFLNASGMYLMVEWLGVMYIFAQLSVSLIVAGESFLLCKYIIFEKKKRWL
ncbi:MAG: GtrA family protein [Patescibacteria group bacterium]